MRFDPDAVYVTKTGENLELQYSLRSLKANVPHHEVWVFGGAPLWLNDKTVNYVANGQLSSPNLSTQSHTRRACKDQDVSDPFVLWNDDFYAMSPVSGVPVLHRGTTADLIGAFSGTNSPWVHGLRETHQVLTSKMGCSNPLSYDLHVPMLVYKEPMLEALDAVRHSRTGAMHVRTLYGNIVGLGGTEIQDPKMTDRKGRFPDGDWLSSSNHTFRYAVEPVLRYLFPDPCIYETEAA